MQHHPFSHKTKVHLPNTKAKRFAKPITPLNLSPVIEEDSDPKQSSEGTKKSKKFGTPCKVFQEALQTTNNNLETSSNSRNKTKIPTRIGSHGSATDWIHVGFSTAKGYGHYSKKCAGTQSGLKTTVSQGKDDDVDTS
ncbi:hypothetical protein Tco_0910047 [Tanacetum coccineum]|uniref:Uncharacterized protein n=1 Tax=Tanacetum coccineum TaxID=301880 RepID=A0ABQ5CTH9_9ASTR